MVASFIPFRLSKLVVSRDVQPSYVLSSLPSGPRIQLRQEPRSRFMKRFYEFISPFLGVLHANDNRRGVIQRVGKITQERGSARHE